jgi:hypothetical protein
VRAARSLLVWFALLVGLWELLVGTVQRTEVLAGLIAAGVGVLFVAALRAQGLLAFTLDLRTSARAVRLVWQLPVEFCVIAWVLARSIARGERVRGRWVHTTFPAAPAERGRGRRAFGAAIGTATPNAIVVDLAAGGDALLHSLAPQLPGGREVL